MPHAVQPFPCYKPRHGRESLRCVMSWLAKTANGWRNIAVRRDASKRIAKTAEDRSHLNYRHVHDCCKQSRRAPASTKTNGHLHKFRDSAATRWLRAGIDVRTVQAWLGHESPATTQKYPEPSKGDGPRLARH